MFSFVAVTIHRTGIAGVFVLMLVENIIPVIPSELIMPMAGFESAQGGLDPVWVVIAGTIGSIIGGAAWYWAGRRVGLEGLERHLGGRWLPVSPEEVRRAQAWFERYGAAAVCVGRSLPGVRGVICIPAGFARMPLLSFLIWSSLGALIWTIFLTWSGYVLKAHFEQLGRWLNPISTVFLVFCAGSYLYRVIRYRPTPRPPV